MLQVREMRFHRVNVLVVQRIGTPLDGALVAKMRFVGSNASLHIVQTRGGQTCSMDDSFAEKQKRQQAAKTVCSVNTDTVKNASFTLNDVQ